MEDVSNHEQDFKHCSKHLTEVSLMFGQLFIGALNT